MTMISLLRTIHLCCVGWSLVLALGAGAQVPEGATAPLEVESIVIVPDPPAAETLCKLRVRIRNGSDKAISGLELRVALGGQELAVYRNQLFMDLLAARATTEIELFNFWTTESARPALADGKLRLEVSLERASWLEITTAEDGTETWTLQDGVPGLPSAKQLDVVLRANATP